MKLFYSRLHALKFLKIEADTLRHAVHRHWIRVLRLGPPGGEQFFLRSDLADFRDKYRSGYFDPSAALRRSQQRHKLRSRGADSKPSKF